MTKLPHPCMRRFLSYQRVERKNLALTKACSPTLKSGAGERRVTGVSRALITELSFRNGGLEFLVKFIEVDY